MGSSSKSDYHNAPPARERDPEVAKLERDLHSNVLKRQAKYDAQKAQEEKKEDTTSNIGNLLGTCELSKEKIKQILDSDRRIYYRTEELNDKLYIHYGGYSKFENLEGFTGLKTLYAECNALESVEGLENCLQLRSLFLQENCFRTMRGLARFTECWSLNFSSNFLESISDIGKLPKLNTLLLAKNRIGFNGIEDLLDLVGSNVSCLDIQDNKIDDPEILPEVLMRMPKLSCLYLKGNPVCKKIPNYRKTITACLKGLKYLDDRPVFVEDRRYAEAFNRGGMEEERAERKRFKQEKDEQHRRNMEAFKNMVENARKEKQEREMMRMEDKYTDDTDPVEHPDRRVMRLKKEWEEKNADHLKDDAKEYAERCLEAEREARKTKRNTKKNEDKNNKAAGEDDEEEEEEEEDEPPTLEERLEQAHVDQEDAPYAPKKKVDNRALVYDDIWDDVPVGSSSSACPLPEQIDPQEKKEKAEKLFEKIWDQGAEMLKQQGAGSDEIKRLKEMKEAAIKGFGEAEKAEQQPTNEKKAESGSGSSCNLEKAQKWKFVPKENDNVAAVDTAGKEEKPTRMVIQGDDDDDDESDDEGVVVEEVERNPTEKAAPAPKFVPPPRVPAAAAAAAAPAAAPASANGATPSTTTPSTPTHSTAVEQNELDEMD